ncbi:serine/threonine-protein kinase [Collinsella tanakaei]|uniref:serine/threonine-protein kinase n=1 Tax=Collinsella tanakaei TaxID=626935 RepID=UPI0025A33CE8|nr:AarF/UbiB family protein [Collinsella tanakaei]MDM8299311.1 protein kinase [Collinsella tanakaei]
MSTKKLARADVQTAAPAHESFPVDGMRMVRIGSFEEPYTMTAEQRDAYRRRFLALFADDSTARRGGLGTVVRVANAFGETYALKLVTEPERFVCERDEDYAKRVERARAAFREEYETHRVFSNFKGFPRLYGYGFVDGTPAIVMEWIEGVTLAQARRMLAVDDAGRLAPLTAARIGRDLFDVLTRLSLVGNGFVHRDISPANIMVRTSHLSLAAQVEEGAFDLCLIDFGSSSVADSDQGRSFTAAHAFFRHATQDYASPEMLSDDLPDVRRLRSSSAIDVYSAASVLYELIDGGLPYDLSEHSGEVRSPYRIKMDTAPRHPNTAHGHGADIASVLIDEPSVAITAGQAARELGLEPNSIELQRALELVDGQLVDIVLSCLESDQGARPSVEAVRDGIGAFCENYTRNVDRAIHGESLIPCTDHRSWLSSVSPYTVHRIVYTVGKAFALGVLAVVVFTTAIVLGGARTSLLCGPIGWEGRLAAPLLALVLALPWLAGVVSCGRLRGTRQGFVRGSAGLVAAAAIIAVAALCTTVGPARQQALLLAPLFAAAAAGWCPLVLDYAMTVLPALVAESRRKPPALCEQARSALAWGAGVALPESDDDTQREELHAVDDCS